MPGAQSSLVGTRRIVAGAFMFVGLFVLFHGLGQVNQAIMLAGGAIIVLAFSARVASTLRRSPRQWLPGTGQVIEASEAPPDAQVGRCVMQLSLDVPGLPGGTAQVREARVPVDRWPRPGDVLPVIVAADNVRHIRVQWDEYRPEAALVPAGVGAPALVEETGAPVPGGAPVVAPLIDPGELAGLVAPGGAFPQAPGQGPGEPGAVPGGPGEGPGGDEDVPVLESDWEEVVPVPVDQGAGAVAGSVAEVAEAEAVGGGGDEEVEIDFALDGPPTGTVAAAIPRPRPSPRPREAAGASAPRTGTAVLDPGRSGGIEGVGVTMLVTDLARSVGFYRDRLGFREVDGGDDTAVLASGGTRLVLRESAEAGGANRRMVYLNLEVTDIDGMYARLRADGVRFTSPPRAASRTDRLELWAAAFRDPDGHGVAITQWRPRHPDG